MPAEIGIAADFLQKLSAVWRGKLDLAKKAKEPFDAVRDQCMTFVCGGAEDFWADEFQRRFLGTKVPTRFRIVMNKAFEAVSIFGPMLYAQNPVRDAYPPTPVEIPPELFGNPEDPMVQQIYAEFMAEQGRDSVESRVLCSLAERYLNATPIEQPDGGLQLHSEDAITDALVGGLGLLWPETYTMPGSNRKLTGCFYRSADRFLADPDVRTLDFGKCTFIACTHTSPVWDLERRFRLPPGSLKKWSYRESAHAQAARRADDLGNFRAIQGQTHDLVEWAEIWSAGGMGCRLSGADESLRVTFDEVVGDYAYIALAYPSTMPFPLNCPPRALQTESVEEIQRRFRWPVPFWQDRRWPCSMLRFYRHPRRQYPIAPLGPGLGELIFMNFILSRLCNHVWQSSRQFVGVLESAIKEVRKVLERGDDLTIIPVKDMQKAINQIIGFLQYPNMIRDVYDVYDRMAVNFERRTGLYEVLYAGSNTEPRSATESRGKRQSAGIRPDYMAHVVEEWQSEVATMEKLTAYWGDPLTGPVSGYDVAPLVGTAAARIWDHLFVNADPERIAREVYCRVVAGSARKRNRDMELASIQEFYGPMSQQLTLYAQTSGDPQAANTLNQKLFDALNYDGAGLEMGPWMPPPPPPGAGPEEEQMAEEELKAMELAAKLQREQAEHEQEMRHAEEEHNQEMQQKEEKAILEIKQKRAAAEAQLRVARAQARAKAQAASQPAVKNAKKK